MAVREFDASSSNELVRAIGALSGMTFGTVAATIKLDTATATEYAIVALHTSGDAARTAIATADDDTDFAWFNGASLATTEPADLVSIGDWMVVIADKTTGTTAPRFSVYNYTSETWDHADADAISNASSPGAGGNVRFSLSGSSNFFDGRVAIAAVWSNSHPWVSDGAKEDAGLELAAYNWDAAGPNAGWLFNQPTTGDDVLDWTGNGADQTSLSGTTVVNGDDPPGFNFSLSTLALPPLVMSPPVAMP